MPKNRNQMMRIHTIDACLQRRNRLWTIDDLVEACEDALYEFEGISEISSRTIRRDLQLMRSEKLGYSAPIVVVDKKYYTYEDPDFSITKLPLTSDDLSALSSALDIVRHYSAFSGLAGQEDIITRMQDKVQSQESHREVVFLETNERLKGIGFLGTLYDYIIKETPLVIRYRSFAAKIDTAQHLSPYILKEFNNRWFLLGYSPTLNAVRTLALDRIASIEPDKENGYVRNTFFDPRSYFGEMVGVSRRIDQPTQEVVLNIDSETAPYIETKPLHGSQQIVGRNGDGSVQARIDVILNLELERLLLGFGRHIEVVSPRGLRDRIAAHLADASNIYSIENQIPNEACSN